MKKEKMTAAQRKAAERSRYKEAGLVAVTVWVNPDDRATVQAKADELNEQRQQAKAETERMEAIRAGAWPTPEELAKAEKVYKLEGPNHTGQCSIFKLQNWLDFIDQLDTLDATHRIPTGSTEGIEQPDTPTVWGIQSSFRPGTW